MTSSSFLLCLWWFGLQLVVPSSYSAPCFEKSLYPCETCLCCCARVRFAIVDEEGYHVLLQINGC